jgi:hemerythrin-like domain-containing protein
MDILREEHRVILRALGLLESASARLAAGQALPDGWWEALLGWLRAFADRNHHAKEERSLFPALAAAGVPSAGGPIGVMLEEHEVGRRFIRTMVEGEPRARVEAARRYVQLLREHIDKENGVLLPLSEAVLDPEVQKRVQREFETFEAEQGRQAELDWAEAEVVRLEQALG